MYTPQKYLDASEIKATTFDVICDVIIHRLSKAQKQSSTYLFSSLSL